jgi:hypothetical protein
MSRTRAILDHLSTVLGFRHLVVIPEFCLCSSSRIVIGQCRLHVKHWLIIYAFAEQSSDIHRRELVE